MGKVSIIIPAYNEEKIIKETLDGMRNFFRGYNYEIIVSADGCTDRTHVIVNDISRSDSRIKLIASSERLGKGGGLKRGFESSKGGVIVFADADGSCSPLEIMKLINGVKSFDIVIASRAVEGSKLLRRQSFFREHMGKTFNLILRILFGVSIKDTQCGYKAFRREALKKILPKVKSNGWEFDAELLYKAKRFNFTIKEMGVEWKNRGESKLAIFPDSLKMLWGLIKLRLS